MSIPSNSNSTSRRRPWIGLVVVGMCLTACWNRPLGAADATIESVDRLLDSFVATIKSDKSLPAERVKKVEDAVQSLRETPEGKSVALTEGLCELYPAYRTALTALAEEDLPTAVQTLTELRATDNLFLKSDAGYFLARARLLDERFEEALPLLDELLASQPERNIRPGETLFLKGVAEAQMLRHNEATQSLERFLKDFPDAPERMRVGAFRQLEQLKMYQEGTLSDVHLRMDFSRRRLALEDPGSDTRAQQDKIVDILAKLIKEAEERECNDRGGGSGSGQKKGQGQGSDGDSQAQGDGSGQQGNAGGGSKGTDSESLQRLHRGGPRSPWSHLRDKERDPVFNAIKEKYPARYQQLIEQYYKSFGDTEGG